MLCNVCIERFKFYIARPLYGIAFCLCRPTVLRGNESAVSLPHVLYYVFHIYCELCMVEYYLLKGSIRPISLFIQTVYCFAHYIRR